MLETFIPRKKPSITRVLGSLKSSLSQPLVKGGKSVSDMWEQIERQPALVAKQAKNTLKKNGV